MPNGPPGPGPKVRRRVLARPVAGPGMSRVDEPAIHGVEHLERADDRAGGRHLPLEATARHLVDHLAQLDRGGAGGRWPARRSAPSTRISAAARPPSRARARAQRPARGRGARTQSRWRPVRVSASCLLLVDGWLGDAGPAFGPAALRRADYSTGVARQRRRRHAGHGARTAGELPNRDALLRPGPRSPAAAADQQARVRPASAPSRSGNGWPRRWRDFRLAEPVARTATDTVVFRGSDAEQIAKPRRRPPPAHLCGVLLGGWWGGRNTFRY